MIYDEPSILWSIESQYLLVNSLCSKNSQTKIISKNLVYGFNFYLISEIIF